MKMCLFSLSQNKKKHKYPEGIPFLCVTLKKIQKNLIEKKIEISEN
jgi:hypothetical protein